MNENEITVIVKGASKVSKLCDLLHEAQAVAVAGSSQRLLKRNITIPLLPGLTLTFSYITSFSLSAVEPTTIDSYGRLVNAAFTVKYMDAI